jgi:heme/copper-type cytochrome/quinol oxidase subunit 2
MRLVIVGMCFVVAVGVFVAMFLSIWSSRGTADHAPAFAQSAASELVWAAIPCLMILAAAIPAVVAMVSARAGN